MTPSEDIEFRVMQGTAEEEDMPDKPNCYECKWRGSVPGSAHSRCNHPSIGKIDPLMELFGLLGASGRGAMPPMSNTLNVRGNAHGIRNGWFAWPMNFDPTWLENCDVMPRLTPQQIIENSLREEEAFVLEGMRRNDELEGLRKLAEREYLRDKALRIWRGAACGLAIVTGAALLIWWVWA